MRDIRIEAKARELGIPDADLERIAPVLEVMEARWRPLVKTIPFETEPALAFQCPREDAR